MTKKNQKRTRTGLASVAAILALTGFMTIVTTATAAESAQRINANATVNKGKLAGGCAALLTAAGLLTIREVKFNTK